MKRASEAVIRVFLDGGNRRVSDSKGLRSRLPLFSWCMTDGDSILVRDLDNRILWNRGAEEMDGWREEEALGKSLTSYCRPSSQTVGRDQGRGCPEGLLGRAKSFILHGWQTHCGHDRRAV